MGGQSNATMNEDDTTKLDYPDQDEYDHSLNFGVKLFSKNKLASSHAPVEKQQKLEEEEKVQDDGGPGPSQNQQDSSVYDPVKNLHETLDDHPLEQQPEFDNILFRNKALSLSRPTLVKDQLTQDDFYEGVL